MNQNIGFGLTINGKHTWRDYGLVVENTIDLGMPEPKTLIVEVPGSSKRLDLSEALTGRCEYKERTISVTLGALEKIGDWAGKLRAFLNAVHGKKVKVILDSEPEYYLEGRASVKDFKRARSLGKIELEITCDPYKWEHLSSAENWIWDTFNFESGIIRDYRNISIAGSKTLFIQGSAVPMTPVFIVSNPDSSKTVKVSMQGKGTKTLQSGENRFPEWIIEESGASFTFSGNFSVTVSVRGGSL